MRLSVLCGVAAIGLALSARADIIDVPSALCGTFNAAGGYSNAVGHQNYRVGLSPITTTPEHRNFFTFDLTGYAPLPPGSVTSATLKLYLPKFEPGVLLDPGMGYISDDPFEHYVVSAVPFASDMVASPALTAPEALAIFGSLGTGLIVGDYTASVADMGTVLSITLSAPAVAFINATLGSGKITLGGRIETFDGTHVDELLFAFTDIPSPHMLGKEPKLELTIVPGPASAAALMGLLVARRRRR